MPTPESAMFLAAKFLVLLTFDGVDYDDTKRLKQAQDAIIREQWVQVMMGRLIHDELRKCYMREGANHLENCGHQRGQILHSGPKSLDIHERTSAMVDFRPQKTLDEVTNSLIEKYFQLLKTSRVRGYLFEQQNYFSKQEKEIADAYKKAYNRE